MTDLFENGYHDILRSSGKASAGSEEKGRQSPPLLKSCVEETKLVWVLFGIFLFELHHVVQDGLGR
jgi:hypothetical protein